MAGIIYIKGVRTRFQNSLVTEIDKGQTVLTDDDTELDIDVKLRNITSCLEKITFFKEKLEVQSEKMATALEEDEDKIEKVIDDDYQLLSRAVDVCFQLEHLYKKLQHEQYKDEKQKDSRYTETDTHRLIEIQNDMKDILSTQIKQQALSVKKESDRLSAVKLPKIDLITFSGEKTKWTEFWDSFESAVHNNKSLSPVEKFNYLKSKLSGEARSAIAGFALSGDNYSVACELLQKRFGNKQEIIDLHYNKLINLNSATSNETSLRHFLDNVEKHIRSLEVLEENLNQDIVVSIMKSKIPKDVMVQLQIQNGIDEKWTVKSLCERLKEFVVAHERASKGTESNNYVIRRDSRRMNAHNDNRYSGQRPFSQSKPSTAGALVATEDIKKRVKCRYCDNSHFSDQCQKYPTIEDRKKRLGNSCYKCLKRDHFAHECKSRNFYKCFHCKRGNAHHSSLCPEKFMKNKHSSENAHLSTEADSKAENTETEPELLSCNEMVLMQTALTEVKNRDTKNKIDVRLLLDSGSHRSYISEKLARRLSLKEEGEQEIHVVTFGNQNAKTIKTRYTNVDVKLKNGKYMNIKMNIVPLICGELHRKPMSHINSDKVSDMLASVQLADVLPKEHETSSIEFLIGNDYYLDFVNCEKIEIQEGLYLLSSKFGWLLSGRTIDKNNITGTSENTMLVLTFGSELNNTNALSAIDSSLPPTTDLEDFWKIESIGITEKQTNMDDKIAMEQFSKTLKFEDNRYQVTWPWKSDMPELPMNRDLALGRLRSTVTRMKNKPEIMEKYNNVIKDQLQKGVIERTDGEIIEGKIKHYLPHHAVLTPEKTTTKLRVVYDASAKTKTANKSLNECLYRGTVMIHDLCGMLMRFRLHKVAIVSDIEKAFLQVGLQPEARDVTRFFWLKDFNKGIDDKSNIDEYRFCRVPFGVISSPFLLGATIKCHLDTYGTEIATKLNNDIYVDNIITGTETEDEALDLYRSSKSIFSEASMNLREWITNSDYVNCHIPDKDKLDSVNTKVLGHIWNSRDDTLFVNQSSVLNIDLHVTKRNILKQVASVFDPLGLFAPVTMRGKVLIQKLWKQKLDWDENVPKDESLEWQKLKSELKNIASVTVKRCIASKSSGTTKVKYSLVCYTDASKDAYAVSVYLLQENGNTVKSNLVFAKTRLSPTKEMSIPRLELMAVVIGVRCLKYVREELKISLCETYLFTDSQCVLKWIETEKSLNVFVQNRVNEIRSHSNIRFGYVSSKENPADIASRGTTVEKLKKNELWWYGPEWNLDMNKYLQEQKSSNEMKQSTALDFNSELKKGESVLISQENSSVIDSNENPPFGINSERVSSFPKLLRVTAYVIRFIKMLKKDKTCQKGSIQSEELDYAESLWILHIQKKWYHNVFESIQNGTNCSVKQQLGVYKDNIGLLRCKGRLQNINLSEAARFPYLLPKKDHVTRLIIERAHKQQLHSGLSQTLGCLRYKYWIPSGRTVVKSVLNQCSSCRKVEGGAYKMPPMAALPTSRVTETTAFERTGLDYLGPLFIKSTSELKKVWVCLFTCLVTRAVHLEIVHDMTTEEFLLALRRFIAQRGSVKEITSDNAKQFKLAKNTLDLIWNKTLKHEDVQSYLANSGIKWKFIVERAPWFGGFYERLVGLVKRSLRKTLGQKLLSNVQLQTVIKEIESVLNSRPLVYVDSDINSTITLTPGHFITLNPKTGIFDNECYESDPDYDPYESSNKRLLKIWNKGQKLLSQFWKIWLKEYLLSLRERTQTQLKSHRVQSRFQPKVGDVVLIKDDLPRGSWKLGKISQLIVSNDGECRSAKIVLATGNTIGRPLNNLYPIELSNVEPIDNSSNQTSKGASVDEVQARIPRKAAVVSRDKTKQMITDGVV